MRIIITKIFLNNIYNYNKPFMRGYLYLIINYFYYLNFIHYNE